jgi:hypothetical protein
MGNLKLRFRKNKKAIVEDWLPFLVTPLVLFFIVIFFVHSRYSVVSNMYDKTLEIREEIEAAQLLNFFLRSPVKEDYTKNIADLFVLSYYNDDYTQLESLAKNFFNKNYEIKGESSWKLRVIELPENKELVNANKLLKGEGAKYCEGFIAKIIDTISCKAIREIASVYLPLNEKKSLKISLYKLSFIKYQTF